jgi:hypothetical protein
MDTADQARDEKAVFEPSTLIEYGAITTVTESGGFTVPVDSPYTS